jgi:hypothetical protein
VYTGTMMLLDFLYASVHTVILALQSSAKNSTARPRVFTSQELSDANSGGQLTRYLERNRDCAPRYVRPIHHRIDFREIKSCAITNMEVRTGPMITEFRTSITMDIVKVNTKGAKTIRGTDVRALQHATHGYQSWMGSIEAFQDGYLEGYRRGFRQIAGGEIATLMTATDRVASEFV